MYIKEKRRAKLMNVFIMAFVAVGLMCMFYSASNGDIYRFVQQELKIITFLCMIILITNISYGFLCEMNTKFKYSIALLNSILLMLTIFVLNNFLHFIGFVSMFGGSVDVSMHQFFAEDVQYMNYIGLYRYAGIPAVAMTMFYIIDKDICKLLGVRLNNWFVRNGFK